MVPKAVVHLLALATSVPLAMAGYYHLDNQFAFLSVIYSYRLVDEMTGVLLAAVLPLLHISIAIALLFDFRHRRPAFLVAAGLYFVFAVAQASAWARGLDISCGCFWSSEGLPIGFGSIMVPVAGFGVSVLGGIVSPPKPRALIEAEAAS